MYSHNQERNVWIEYVWRWMSLRALAWLVQVDIWMTADDDLNYDNSWVICWSDLYWYQSMTTGSAPTPAMLLLQSEAQLHASELQGSQHIEPTWGIVLWSSQGAAENSDTSLPNVIWLVKHTRPNTATWLLEHELAYKLVSFIHAGVPPWGAHAHYFPLLSILFCMSPEASHSPRRLWYFSPFI